jgi:hypothetical protein
MFFAYYDFKRFRYIHEEMMNSGLFVFSGPEKIRKTGCFYGEKINVYIDTSDGVNEDLEINEYCGRIIRVIEDSAGKPFLFFKAAYSFEKSKSIVDLAEKNNGKVIPFFKWSFNDDFYSYLLPNKDSLRQESSKIKKAYDVGIFAGLKEYEYPKPNIKNKLVAWSDYRNFGLGTPEDTGYFQINSRKKLFSEIKSSNLKLFQVDKISYKDYINKSLECATILNPPGMGEYTSRMVDQGVLGKCIVLRKTSYDQGHSWKNYIPEVDFNSEEWILEYQKIIDDSEEWAEKCKYYFENFWTPNAIVDYLIDNIEKNI